ncbi:hypothetical protein NESM_000069600 [Novymonas esmeraldas]|uniref:Uncharacterized protein n=1 Tax=Novymonas esmeraldas TaxID=1808958 RepID=A0AAW0F4Q7_9TRYP
MLRRVAYASLPRDPRDVRLLHHVGGGVVIAAVRYAPVASRPLFFSVVEMSAPNERAAPLRIVHVRVPQPATEVSSIVLLRSADGAEVFVVVQAAERPRVGAPATSTTTYVYRRQLVVEDSGSEGAGDEEASVDLVSSPPTSVALPTTAARVRYQRMPRAHTSADAAPWTAAAAFYPSANALTGASATGAAASVAAFVTVSGDGSGSSSSGGGGAGCQLRLWQLTGTRVTLEAAWTVPALAGFAVREVLTLPGTQDVVLLRHHSSVVEVDLAAVRSACAHGGAVTGNTFLSRAWRWSAHEQLTACAVKDALLYAATESGAVLVWDLRRPTTAAGLSCGGPPPQRSAELRAPITGLHAPYATGFITCDACGGVRDWRERGEAEEEEEAEAAASRVLHDVGGAAAAAAVAAGAFPYRSRAPVEAPTGEEGCAAMHGHDNFVAVVGECGRLCLYFCD